MTAFKIGFHGGGGGNHTGIGDYFRALDGEGIPVFFKSVDHYGACYELANLAAASHVPHTIVFRLSTRGQNDGHSYDVPNYNLNPIDAAAAHWQMTKAKLPPEFNRNLVWVEPINEVDKGRANWLGEFALAIAKRANAEGYKVSLFGWSSGEPEPSAWDTPGMVAYLDYCAAHPDAAAISLHEYSYTKDNIQDGYPHKIGRFKELFAAADRHHIARPTVHITEWGWEYRDIPPTEQAMADINWAQSVYAPYPQVKGAATWYLGGGGEWNNICNKVQKLIAPVRDLALAYGPPDPEEPPTPPTQPGRGRPRVQYRRIYVLIPSGYPREWQVAAAESSDYTIGKSADDAGIGDLDNRIILAVNPEAWGPGEDGTGIRGFFTKYYPGITFVPVAAATPDQLALLLPRFDPANPVPPTLPAPLPTLNATAWPTPYKTINQAFGARPEYYAQFGLPGHEGLDIRAPHGTPIYSIAYGTVYRIETIEANGGNYGKQVRVRHENGFQSVYAHLHEVRVSLNQVVRGGDIIGLADNTGNSSGDHLHITLKHDEAVPGGRMYIGYPYNIIDPTPILANLNPPLPPPPTNGPARMGLHASADPDILPSEFTEFANLRPDVIKVMSIHSQEDIAALAAAHPSAQFIVRAFISGHENGQPRNISPDQFVRDTVNDVQRSLNALRGRDVFIELHNEVNLSLEGMGGAWKSGTEFNSWFLNVLGQYRARIPGAKFLFPGLSPGGDIPNLRQGHQSFTQQCLPAIAAADGLAIHAYWSAAAPLSTALAVVDWYLANVPNKPIWLTEASNNKDAPADTKASEYVTFWRELKKRPRVQGVTYFIASASDQTFRFETWVDKGMGARVRGKM